MKITTKNKIKTRTELENWKLWYASWHPSCCQITHLNVHVLLGCRPNGNRDNCVKIYIFIDFFYYLKITAKIMFFDCFLFFLLCYLRTIRVRLSKCPVSPSLINSTSSFHIKYVFKLNSLKSKIHLVSFLFALMVNQKVTDIFLLYNLYASLLVLYPKIKLSQSIEFTLSLTKHLFSKPQKIFKV